MDGVIDNIKEKVFQSVIEHADQDVTRDIPLYRDIYHVIGSVRCAILLAKRRGMDVPMAEITMLLHDLSRVEDGKLDNHAAKSAKRAEDVLKILGIEKSDMEKILQGINLHVNKKEKDTEFDELIKDADLLDSYLNGDEIKDEALIRRIDKVKKELSLV